MPVRSPFFPRTSTLCTSMLWKDWAGYHAVRAYETYHEREYFAIRHAAGLLDVTPLFKYEISGPDAAAFLSRVMVRNVEKVKPDQVVYSSWCDEDGKLLDDGTVSRLDADHFRVTANEPNLAWFRSNARSFDVTIEDSTGRIGALSIQGPRSREIVDAVTGGAVTDLKYFRLTRARIDGFDAVVSRTGYTGDLGYEIWVDREHALALWDALVEAGRPFGMEPAGLDALDMARMEAGFILAGVDYFPAQRCLIESRKSTPYEAGLGWMVRLEREAFNGQAALRAEKERGPARKLIGLEMSWDEFEALFARHSLPPEIPNHAWRDPIPVYDRRGAQVGYATSGAWSPMLKKNLALATVVASEGGIGNELRMEVTVEYERRTVPARVVERPFFDPPRKKA